MNKNSISILLSTYNGERFLKEQLESLFLQKEVSFEIIVRDDGSNDKTIDILKSYKDISLIESKKNIGVINSYSILVGEALKRGGDYIMFCDQDDIWMEEKVKITLDRIKKLENIYPNTPILVHTDLEVVDENLNLIDSSFWHYQNIDPNLNSFNRLLLQNIVTGCTVMINRPLAHLIFPIPPKVIMHDWWIGLVASYFGKISYIKKSTIKYRQHNKNDIGAKKFGLSYIWEKILDSNELDGNIEQAKAFLERFYNKLDIETIKILEDFISFERLSFFKRREILIKYGLYKHGFIRNIGLFLKI